MPLRKTIEEHYKEFSGVIYSRCLSYTKCRDDACDLVQQVFLKALKSYSSFRSDSTAFTWYYKITTHVCYDYLKKRKRIGEFEFHVDFREWDMQDLNSESADETLFLKQIIHLFDGMNQQIAFLWLVDGLSQEEIASVLEVSRKTVSRKIKLLKERIRNVIEKGTK